LRLNHRITAIFMALLFFMTIIMPVYADEITDKQQKLQDVSRQINAQNQKLNTVKKKEKSIMGQVQSLEMNMQKTQTDIKTLSDRVEFLQSNLGVTKDEIKISEAELEKQNEILNQRLVFMYEEGDVSYLEVLLSSTDMKDFLTRYDLLNRILQQDQNLIKSVQEKKQNLVLKKTSLETQKQELEVNKQSQQEKQQQLNAQIGDKKVILSSVEKEKNTYQQALNEMEQNSQQLAAMISQMQSKGNPSKVGTGTYSWPTPGYTTITSDYGMRYHPILKVNKLHTGMDIGAPYGVSIHAADSGTVIFSGWMGAYGQAIVIDHGNGISTLYGHQSTLLVSKGTAVSKGQVIGKVGSTGWSTGAHLHFEVRVNGTPVNPHSYV
jgi:murein DD-endopeptidase MepM/ murein hydrolase activator NlpD